MSAKRKLLELATDEYGQLHADPRKEDRGQIATIIAVVTVGIVAIIGILIYSQVQQAVPAPEDPALQNATDDVNKGFGDALSLVPIVLLVMVASLVIGVVQRFGG